MLTEVRRRRRAGSRLFLSGLLAALFVVAVPSMAQADLCQVTSADGSIRFVDCDTVPGNGGGGGGGGNGGGGGEPSCELRSGDNTCIDGKSCLVNIPSLNDVEDVMDELGPKPGDDYVHAFRHCEGEEPTWYWAQEEDQGPSTEELALMALGELPFPTFTPTFNPPGRTLVNLDTWWWADGATTGVLDASAGSVTVTATPSRMEVETGDGTTLDCTFSTTRSDECSHVYQRANAGYEARMRLVWTVEFRDGGTVLTSAALPQVFESEWVGTEIPVREVQTLVVPDRR